MVSGSHWISRYRGWLIVCAAVLLVFSVRLRLRDMPLERDEGEYAYAGQLMLQGVPPYKEAYNMKLPGTYAAYAVIMAVFGQTPSGIHVGVALVNAASIILMFLLGRKILDEITGVVAAVFYALLSTSYSILGLQGHATHFVVLPALGGFLMLLKAVREPALPLSLGERAGVRASLSSSALLAEEVERETKASTISKYRRLLWFALSGLLMGIAFLMKQHGVFFGIFGGLFILYCRINERTLANETRSAGAKIRSGNGSVAPLHAVELAAPGSSTTSENRPATSSRRPMQTVNWRKALIELGVYSAGFLMPWLLTCLILAAAGVFKQFIFWTVTYAAAYVSEEASLPNEAVRFLLGLVVGPNLLLWLAPWVGAVILWWDGRLSRDRRFLLVSFLIFSLASVGVGLYLRPHYFIMLLPALGLLTGIAVSRSYRLIKHDRTIELFLALPILGLVGIGMLACIAGNGSTWFSSEPGKAFNEIYATDLFAISAEVSKYIQNHSKADSKIAILGSEPEIYFLAHRRGATGYIYIYPLMERQAYSLKMQKDMIHDLEQGKPEYVVYVREETSWVHRPNSEFALESWWNSYWHTPYNLVKVFDVHAIAAQELTPDNVEMAGAVPETRNSAILLFQKKP